VNTEEHQSTSGGESAEESGIHCPYCDYGILGPSPNGDYLVCPLCRRKVWEVRVTAPRMRAILNAFHELEVRSYLDNEDKGLAHYVEHAGSAMLGELEARGFPWEVDGIDFSRVGGSVARMAEELAKKMRLSATAFQAMTEMLKDYEFGEGPGFLDDVLKALEYVDHLTAGQLRLRRQVEAIPYAERESLSCAIRLTHK